MALILVRPEVIKNADPQSLCRLSCTSKTLHIDLQGTKAWARLAEAQYPPPTPRDDNEARSHVQRRLLAKAEPPRRRVLEGVTLLEAASRQAPAPVAFTPNELSDFTFFLRLTDSERFIWDSERLIWEGDLGELSRQSDEEGLVLHLSLCHADLAWMGRADDDDLGEVKIALVAIRNHDQAMVPLGHFEHQWTDIAPPRDLSFRPRNTLFHSLRSRLTLWPSLYVLSEANDCRLELRLRWDTIDCRPPGNQIAEDGDESQFRHVLSYLAGIHAGRASALATIESWFVAAERRFGWLEQEQEWAREDAERVGAEADS